MLQELKKELYRKKSLEKISSPEKIDGCIRAVNVRLWIVAAACMLVHLSLLLWGVFGKVEITQRAVTVCQNGAAVCFVDEGQIDEISDDTEFRIGGRPYTHGEISARPEKACDAMSEYAAHVGLYDENQWVYAAVLRADLDDGVYETEVVTQSISPILLLTN